MHLLFRIRFAWLVLLLGVSCLTACEKTDPEPTDLATRVAGVYRYSEMQLDGRTAPADETNIRGNVTITRQTDTSVTIVFALKMKDGSPFLDDTFEDVVVSESGGEITYTVDGQAFARGKGNKFMVSGRDTANKLFTLTATK